MGNRFALRRRKATKPAPTIETLQAMMPEAAVDSTCNGEVVIYTGWALDHRNPNGPLVAWCDECESGADVPDGGCPFCDRLGQGQQDGDR